MILYEQDIERLNEIREYIISNLKMKLKTELIAKKFLIDKHKLGRQFQYHFGITIGQFIHGLRMERAYELLANKKMSVNEVAEEVGYHNRCGFSHAFTAHFKMSPQKVLQS
jgi:transcriptional regulator GlxA family with amidase domain